MDTNYFEDIITQKISFNKNIYLKSQYNCLKSN